MTVDARRQRPPGLPVDATTRRPPGSTTSSRHVLNHVGMAEHHVLAQELLHGHGHPRRRRRPPGRHLPLRHRPGHLGARRRLQGPRARQPLRRRHELLPQHRRGEPGARPPWPTPSASASTSSTGSAERALRRRASLMATRTEIQRRLRRRARAGHRARHVPRREHDLHRPRRVRLSTTQYGALVPPPSGHRDRRRRCSGPRWRNGSAPSACTCSASAASLVAMALLVDRARCSPTNQPIAYPLLLMATAFLGAGFGLTVPSLNTFTAAFHPGAIDRSILVLNALLGLGTALAPVFVAVFVGLGFWWGLPVLSAVLLAGCSRQLRAAAAAERQPPRPRTAGGAEARHPAAVLAVRDLRGALRHLRDHERQLGPARHDE